MDNERQVRLVWGRILRMGLFLALDLHILHICDGESVVYEVWPLESSDVRCGDGPDSVELLD